MEKVGEQANIIMGELTDDEMTDEIRVTVIATGLEQNLKKTPTSPQKDENGRLKFTPYVPPTPPTSHVSSSVAAEARASEQKNKEMEDMLNRIKNDTPSADTTQTSQQNAGGFTGMRRPEPPRSSVQERDIQIPDFLKNKQ